MSLRLGIVMDPIANISFKKDSSLAMLLAAQARGWSLFYMEQQDLYQVRGQARARLRSLEVFNDPQRWFTLGTEQDTPLAELDVILMRKDPPFDNEFVYHYGKVSAFVMKLATCKRCYRVASQFTAFCV